ncbi:hypothetical protein PGT21_033714 [Puccinia graminis f. sp. tritici]|uniref:Uncharacterized protein n=1 Tax=Puccinia graminis f. sp. tritici TaxID=56615 RepID=A0A5B0QPQ2_PUCGR|nr:hypothetical protein PGT21_033714 [Puccinia graminis f. sp. tritici]
MEIASPHWPFPTPSFFRRSDASNHLRSPISCYLKPLLPIHSASNPLLFAKAQTLNSVDSLCGILREVENAPIPSASIACDRETRLALPSSIYP